MEDSIAVEVMMILPQWHLAKNKTASMGIISKDSALVVAGAGTSYKVGADIRAKLKSLEMHQVYTQDLKIMFP